MKKLLLIVLLPCSFLFARHKATIVEAPWLTGPLIVPTSRVTPWGQVNIEPFLYEYITTGNYDSHWHAQPLPNYYSFSPTFFAVVGLTSFMDFQFLIPCYYNSTEGVNDFQFGDVTIGVDFQLLNIDAVRFLPGIKLGFNQTFPSGKYNDLDPLKLQTDEGGYGSYITNINLGLYKLLSFGGDFFMTIIANITALRYSHIPIKGFSSWGGGYGANAIVKPGMVYQAILSFEASVSRHWAFAIDNVYQYAGKTTFSGYEGIPSSISAKNPGFTFGGQPVNSFSLASPSSQQFSIAPAIEYNFSVHCGIIAGCWFTVAGKNTSVFVTPIVAVDIFF